MIRRVRFGPLLALLLALLLWAAIILFVRWAWPF